MTRPRLEPTAQDISLFNRLRITDSDIRARIVIENAIVRTACESLVKEGFALRLWDGEAYLTETITQDVATLMADLQACEEEWLFVYKRGTKKDGTEGWLRFGTAYMVYGNDGWDVVADYSVNLEDALRGANAMAELFADEGCDVAPVQE